MIQYLSHDDGTAFLKLQVMVYDVWRKQKNGELFFGSNHGVLLYDGINWESIALDSVFKNHIVTNLFVTESDEIYASTDSGLYKYNNQNWKRLFPESYNSKISKLYKVGKIQQLNDGSLLISTGQTFYSGLLHLKDNQFTFYSS
ncbi:MAG: hypothetical protein JW717_12600 [Marinilabiliaceae bacterium]|nr:hypothetical protein [Marinilabiliaceae bacterium]